MKHKSKAFDKFKEYQSMVKRQTEKGIKSQVSGPNFGTRN